MMNQHHWLDNSAMWRQAAKDDEEGSFESAKSPPIQLSHVSRSSKRRTRSPKSSTYDEKRHQKHQRLSFEGSAIHYDSNYSDEDVPHADLKGANYEQGDNDAVPESSDDEGEESLRALLEQQKRLTSMIEAKIQVKTKRVKGISAEHRWAKGVISMHRDGPRNIQVKTLGAVSQYQASQNDEPSRAPSPERPGNPVARQLSSGSSGPSYVSWRAISTQVPNHVQHPRSFARRAAMEREVFPMSASRNGPLPPGSSPTLDPSQRNFLGQLPVSSSPIENHACVSRGMKQLEFQVPAFNRHQQNIQNKDPAVVNRGATLSLLEVASQGASHPNQPSFCPSDSDEHSQKDVRSDTPYYRGSSMLFPGRNGRVRPRAMYFRRRRLSANLSHVCLPPSSSPLTRVSLCAPQKQLGYYNAPIKDYEDDQEEQQISPPFNERILFHQGSARQGFKNEIAGFFQVDKKPRPRQAKPTCQQSPLHRNDHHPQTCNSEFSKLSSPCIQPLRRQAMGSPSDPYSAQREQMGDLSHDDKHVGCKNCQWGSGCGYEGGCWPPDDRYRKRRGPELCPGSGCWLSGGGRVAQKDPCVGESYHFGGLGQESGYHRCDDEYSGRYEDRDNGDVNERMKKRMILPGDTSLDFYSSDFSNVEEYCSWNGSETLGGCNRATGKEPHLLRHRLQNPLVNMVVDDPVSMRHLSPNALSRSIRHPFDGSLRDTEYVGKVSTRILHCKNAERAGLTITDKNEMTATKSETGQKTSQRNQYASSTSMPYPQDSGPAGTEDKIDRGNSQGPQHDDIQTVVSSQTSLPVLKVAQQQPTHIANAPVGFASATGRPRPDSMTLPIESQPMKSQLPQLPKVQGWKPVVPAPLARPLNFSGRFRTQKAQSSVVAPAKEAPATEIPDEAQKSPAPNVTAQTAAVDTSINAASPVIASPAETQPAVKEKPLSLAEITKQKQQRAAKRRAERVARSKKHGFVPTLSKAEAFRERLLQDPAYQLKELSLFVSEDDAWSASFSPSSPSRIPRAVFPTNGKGKGTERDIFEGVPVKMAELQEGASKSVASDVDALLEESAEPTTQVILNAISKARSAASPNGTETTEADADAQAVADLTAKTDEKQRLRRRNIKAAAEDETKGAKERASAPSKRTTPCIPKKTDTDPWKTAPLPALLRFTTNAPKGVEQIIYSSVGSSCKVMTDVGGEELKVPRSGPSDSFIITEPKEDSTGPNPSSPVWARPKSSVGSTLKAPHHSQQLEPPVPEVNPAQAEAAEIPAMRAHQAILQAEASAGEKMSKKEAAGKAAQKDRIEDLAKALAEKQSSCATSVTDISSALTQAKIKLGRPQLSNYEEQAHALTEQEKRARDIRNNSHYMKADKAWTKRYLKKYGNFSAIPSNDAAVNADREKYRIKWWKERTKRDHDADESAMAKVEAQTEKKQAQADPSKPAFRDGGGILDRLRKSNEECGLSPIKRTKEMRNEFDHWKESKHDESSESEEDGDYQPRRKVGDKTLPGSSSQASLLVHENHGADEGEAVTRNIWTIYVLTIPYAERDSEVSFKKKLETASSETADVATHCTHTSLVNADNDDIFGDSTLAPEESHDLPPLKPSQSVDKVTVSIHSSLELANEAAVNYLFSQSWWLEQVDRAGQESRMGAKLVEYNEDNTPFQIDVDLGHSEVKLWVEQSCEI